MAEWYVVQTLARAEQRADTNLKRQGFQSYLPQLRCERRHARKREVVPAPLFPGYLFVRLDLSQQRWRSINGTFGVSQLICYGDRPAAAPAGIVEELMTRENEDGLITLEPRRFIKGETLRFVSGTMKDCLGLFEGMAARERVIVLLDLLGRKVRVETHIGAVAAVG